MSIVVTANKIKAALEQTDSVLLVIHQQPDHDALGSLAAFGEWLDQLNKQHTAFCFGTSLADCAFINEQRQLIAEPKQLAERQFDVLVSLDSGATDHAAIDKIVAVLRKKPTIINIDHHATNNGFGEINLVQPDAASTTEVLYQLFEQLNVALSPRMASSLLAGIIGDTYGFTNPNTSARCLAIAAKLVKQGAKLSRVSDAILRNKTVPAMQLWGTILKRLHHNPTLNIATTIIAAEDLNDDKSTTELTEGIANFLNNLSGVDAALVLRQDGPDLIKGSLRTNNDTIDVAKLAGLFGGGGHKKAAGFRIKGRLQQDEKGGWQIV